MTNEPITILFNGSPGVGKTTLTKEFAKQSKHGAYVDVDVLRSFVVGGKASARDPNRDEKFLIRNLTIK